MSSPFRLKRKWTAAEADDWTKEDFIAAAIGVVCFVAIAIGTPHAFLLRPVGFFLLGTGLLLGGLMLWTINPKRETVSADYEKKQKECLKQLEKFVRWVNLDEE